MASNWDIYRLAQNASGPIKLSEAADELGYDSSRGWLNEFRPLGTISILMDTTKRRQRLLELLLTVIIGLHGTKKELNY